VKGAGLTKYGDDVAENTRTWGGAPGSVQPAACAGCGSDDRMSFTTLRGRKYWTCDHCDYPHESDQTQGTACGTSAYANPFEVGDFVRKPGDWGVLRVTRAYRSGERGHGYFEGVLVVDGFKYHALGEREFTDASGYKKQDDPGAFVASLGRSYKFVPNHGG